MAQPSMEQVIAQTVQGGLNNRSSRTLRAHVTPIEPMEPIVEERSELAMDIAQAVVEKLDIERKLDDRLKELMLRGDRVFRDIQIRQEQSTEALCRSVGMCLESQRAFHEEHQRLLAAVKDLAAMVMPYTPFASQASDAQSRANAIMEETEALKKQMEEHRLAASCAISAAAALAPVSPMPIQQPLPTLSPHNSNGGTTFSITLRKADEVSLGLSVNDTDDGQALVVEGVLPGGAVESYNRQSCGSDRVVVAGDVILKVNSIEKDVQKMLEECTKSRLVKLVLARGPAAAHARASATAGSAPQPAGALARASSAPEPAAPQFETPEKISMMRKRAPEFVPAGADAQPLGQTQHLAAPPGLFLRPDAAKKLASEFEDARKESAAAALVDGVLDHLVLDDDGSDKEN